MERGLSRNQIITALTRSPHGELKEFVQIGKEAALREPEFLAHLIAWNRRNGQVRDSKVALPVVHLSVPYVGGPDEFAENSLAHLALLDPRNLVRAMRFAREIKTPGRARALLRVVEKYLRVREENISWWDRTAVQHRASIKTLYALFHIKPGERANRILFEGKFPTGSAFEAIAQLKNMTAIAAAAAIVKHKLPFLVVVGAMGSRLKETDVVLALIERMSPAELVNNMNMLERFGVKKDPALRAALEAGLNRVADSKDLSLKLTVAADAVEDEQLSEKLHTAQEKQIAALGGVDGDWLVLGDRSPSMKEAVVAARHLAATLAKMVKGSVHLVFFDSGVYRYIDATGKNYDALLTETRSITEGGGGTSIGAGLQYVLDKGILVDGIAIASDGAENTPPYFARAYTAYSTMAAKSVPVYLYWMNCHQPNDSNNNPERLARSMIEAEHDLQVFDLRAGFDYVSLPNIVKTMHTQRYGLAEAIMQTPLLRLDDVWKKAA